jgi:TetR/AcrR family transcriptional repressor of nem operon
VETALESAFATFTEGLRNGGPDAVQIWREIYLSDKHVNNPGRGCPVPALGQDVGRGTSEVKAAFGRGVDDIVEALAATMDGPDQARRTAALQQFSMLVGAVVIARAVGPQLGDEVIAAVSQAVAPGGKTKKGHRS